MVDTLEKIKTEQQAQQAAQLLEALPFEERVELCIVVLLLSLQEAEQKKQHSSLGTAVKVALSHDQRPVATLLAFAGPGAPHIATALDGIAQYIRSLEAHLAGGEHE
jgi:hypothetical protein